MNVLFYPDLTKPTIEIFEEPDGMRIECQGQPTKFLTRKNAIELLRYIGDLAFEEGNKFSL